MNSQNTIFCAIFGLAVPTVSTHKRIRGRLLAGNGGAFVGRSVPIAQGTIVHLPLDPVGVMRR